MDPHGATARRFPLVARVRPPCLPLHTRIDKLTELADTALTQAYQGLASSVFNQAALLASDLDLPDLARQWCHQHAAAYLQHTPLTGMDAIRALEPIVNLARLHIRASTAPTRATSFSSPSTTRSPPPRPPPSTASTYRPTSPPPTPTETRYASGCGGSS